MSRKFDDIEIGAQLELPAHRATLIVGPSDGRDPDRVVRVAIVTHIWHDPVDDKEYVGLAYLRNDGSYGKPTEKRTITGLARCGWRYAARDWVAFAQARHDAGGTVVPMFGKRPARQ